MTYSGIVSKGSKRATSLGFPTANIPLHDASISGVYVARVFLRDAEYAAAVFADPKRKLLEAYLLDFSGDIYGEEIRVALMEKIRDTQRFDDDEALQAAVASDIERVKRYFSA